MPNDGIVYNYYYTKILNVTDKGSKINYLVYIEVLYSTNFKD